MTEFWVQTICVIGCFADGKRGFLWFIGIFITHFAFKYW